MLNKPDILKNIGVVIIGRNEGERLIRCLETVSSQSNQLVYVDSASTDDSVNNARLCGAEVVILDLSLPFSAARARNEGFARMQQLFPHTEYVQFIDGDCEMIADWMESAVNFLSQHQDVAVVCGRRREHYPGRSVYNLLCNIEWDTPVGEARACGGDAMMRVNAFKDAQGFRTDLIAGEEPELCLRLRAKGWKIWRMPDEMSLHDAAMIRLGQWWKRTRRTGYGFAEGAYLHGAMSERNWVRETRRALIWGLIIPATTVLLTIWLGFWGLFALLIYPVQVIRLALRGTRSARENWWHAFFLVLGKFPEALGQLNFFYYRLTEKKARLIEYK